MSKQTPLHSAHVEMSAKMVDFAGWDMPIHYGSQIEEHHHVRTGAGMFDVSHMTVVDIKGTGAADYLRYLLANNIDKLKDEGKALYSCMLNESGGVVDDLIVYYMNEQWYRLVVNSATREKDLDWLDARLTSNEGKKFAVSLTVRDDLSMIAVQGPEGREKALEALQAEGLVDEAEAAEARALKRFFGREMGTVFVGRTGYTGEDGFEILLPVDNAVDFWRKLAEVGVKPCGLGARDTLRLEAGMNLYGGDMDESVSPLESGLGWTVAMEPAERHFFGREALQQQQVDGIKRKLVGLVLEGKGVLRDHMRVVTPFGDGEITSGSFSPTLSKAIAFARIPVDAQGECEIEMRGRLLAASIIKLPFVRDGKSCL